MTFPDHPRACGENTGRTYCPAAGRGSPPRVRGKPLHRRPDNREPGITPARAGKTGRSRVPDRQGADHPRACGENQHDVRQRSESEGSPPRVRGKRIFGCDLWPISGITPARAGKTVPRGDEGVQTADHPRACGENIILPYSSGKTYGSPPRVRGKLDKYRDGSLSLGITPARAGKTSAPRACGAPAADHPRACGENVDQESRLSSDHGSPPRVRGKRRRIRPVCAAVGITPARAGKTPRARPARSSCADHPRACGENRLSHVRTAACQGSPPRVRGKRVPVRFAVSPLRITPARAGKTELRSAIHAIPQDHPRACGENLSMA